MDVELIEMAEDKAKEKYRLYRDSVVQAANKQEEKINEGLKRAYRYMGQGHQLIDVETAFRAGGFDEQGRPKLGLIRAHREMAFLYSASSNVGSFYIGDSAEVAHRSRSTSFMTYNRVRCPESWLGDVSELREAKNTRKQWTTTYSSPVPVIPLELRPTGGLSGYHILFEAVWDAIPDPDPLLLKHCYGTLFAVVAQWDMTPLETAVLKNSIVSV